MLYCLSFSSFLRPIVSTLTTFAAARSVFVSTEHTAQLELVYLSIFRLLVYHTQHHTLSISVCLSVYSFFCDLMAIEYLIKCSSVFVTTEYDNEEEHVQ